MSKIEVLWDIFSPNLTRKYLRIDPGSLLYAGKSGQRDFLRYVGCKVSWRHLIFQGIIGVDPGSILQ